MQDIYRKKYIIFYNMIDQFIYYFYITGFLYASYMLFSINHDGIYFRLKPLFGKINKLKDIDFFKRRLYAIEFWVILSNFLIYRELNKLNSNFSANYSSKIIQ